MASIRLRLGGLFSLVVVALITFWTASLIFNVGVLVGVAADAPNGALRLIREKCVKCHSGDKPPAGLRLDSVDNMVRGGKRGPAIVPGKPDASLIYQALTGENGLSRMPPFIYLEESEVAIIRRWIYRGAQQMSMGGQEP